MITDTKTLFYLCNNSRYNSDVKEITAFLKNMFKGTFIERAELFGGASWVIIGEDPIGKLTPKSLLPATVTLDHHTKSHLNDIKISLFFDIEGPDNRDPDGKRILLNKPLQSSVEIGEPLHLLKDRLIAKIPLYIRELQDYTKSTIRNRQNSVSYWLLR